jgi:hypothetical protein
MPQSTLLPPCVMCVCLSLTLAMHQSPTHQLPHSPATPSILHLRIQCTVGSSVAMLFQSSSPGCLLLSPFNDFVAAFHVVRPSVQGPPLGPPPLLDARQRGHVAYHPAYGHPHVQQWQVCIRGLTPNSLFDRFYQVRHFPGC